MRKNIKNNTENFLFNEIKVLNKKYKNTWGKEVDYSIIPRKITQEKLIECLKLMINTNDSLLIAYKKLYIDNKSG